MSLRSWVRAHARIVGIAGLAFAAALVFVLVWFQPQKLFVNDVVSEPPPISSPTRTEVSPVATTAAPLPSGQFRSLEHDTTGTARIVRTVDRLVLRLEGFRTSNGPDLVVYLSRKPATLGDHDYGTQFISLGKLKGNIGDQNYAIPAGTDITMFHSAAIWCRRFSVGFGVAPLT